ncbi:MAG TPA: hypothetical protein VD931_11930 [Baekduia sp.]|nr:hypothetical protein [Baekduia sp.]
MAHLSAPSVPAPARVDRQRAVLAETAIAAAGGGRLRGLAPVGRLRDRWLATVRTDEGHVTVELDTRLRTVVVRPPLLRRAAA